MEQSGDYPATRAFVPFVPSLSFRVVAHDLSRSGCYAEYPARFVYPHRSASLCSGRAAKEKEVKATGEPVRGREEREADEGLFFFYLFAILLHS